MARAKKDSAATATEARALVALVVDGARIVCGAAFSASAETIAELVANGQADSHPEAVLAAKDLER